MAKSKPNNGTGNGTKSPSKIIGNSKRLTLVYIVLLVWIGLAVFAIIESADLYGLAVYFASGLPLILGYLWSETSRPSIKDAAEILKNIKGGKSGRDNNHGEYKRHDDDGDDVNVNIYPTNPPEEDVIIYFDDASAQLTVDQNQLTTLMNIGYVDISDDKYTFDKSLLGQIKSLISDNIQEPEI